MKFSLIICTYQRPISLTNLLQSIQSQSLHPDQVIVVDGSEDNSTEAFLLGSEFENLEYYHVDVTLKGLTKQRNFGVSKVLDNTDIVFFLDDDTILDYDYFEQILRTYQKFPKAVGVSGYISNEVSWKKVSKDYKPLRTEYKFDNWVRTNSSRFILRHFFGLAPDVPPGYMPEFSHGYSISYLPPSGKIYEVGMLMGGIASYKKSLLKEISFSSYFEGYGLYEDADFSIRASGRGKLFVNTSAKLEHHHASEGRPNMYKYGKMVVRNGWYVWRVKTPCPSIRASMKWHSITFLLTLVRVGNIINTGEKKEALFESLGRFAGWGSLFIKKPTLKSRYNDS